MKINPSAWKLFFKKEETVLAIPSWTMPRVYFPSRSARQRWDDAGAFYPALRIRSKLVRLGFQLVATLFPKTFALKPPKANDSEERGVIRKLIITGIQRIRLLKHSALFQALVPEAYGLASDSSHLNANFNFCMDPWIEKLPEFDHAVVLVGAASDAKQKMIVRMEDQAQRVLAYMKYAEQPLALEKINNEKEVLNAIPSGLGPEVLKFDQFGEGQALLMTTVPGKPLPSRMPPIKGPLGFEDIHNHFLKFLIQECSFKIDEHPAIRRICAQLAKNKNPITDNQLNEILVPLRERAWPAVIQHGDLTPWNLYELEGTLGAVDWEDGLEDGFIGFDLVYFCVQTGYFLHQWPSQKVFDIAINTLDGSLSQLERSSVVRLGALDAFLRGLDDGMPADHPLQQFRVEIVNFDG